MKIKFSLFFSTLVLILLIVSACGQANTSKFQESNKQAAEKTDNKAKEDSEPIVLKYASDFSKTHIISIEADQFFMKRVEELSNGRVKFEYYPDSQLGKPKDAINLLKTRVTDIALTAPSYESGKMPLSNALLLPQIVPNAEAGTKALWDLMKDPNSVISKYDYQKNKLHPLYIGVSPLYEILTAKKPIHTIEDLKGLKLRNAGGPQAFIIESFGATPVSTTVADQYIALERGTIDGGVYGLPFTLSLKIDEVTKYLTTNAKLSAYVFGGSITDEKWEKLPKDIQEALTQAGEETTLNLAKKMDQANEEAIEKFKSVGHEAYTFTPDQLEKIKKLTLPVWDIWLRQMKKQGLPGDEAIKELQAALKKYE